MTHPVDSHLRPDPVAIPTAAICGVKVRAEFRVRPCASPSNHSGVQRFSCRNRSICSSFTSAGAAAGRLALALIMTMMGGFAVMLNQRPPLRDLRFVPALPAPLLPRSGLPVLASTRGLRDLLECRCSHRGHRRQARTRPSKKRSKNRFQKCQINRIRVRRRGSHRPMSRPLRTRSEP
jgi:hypothetical protein